MFNAHVRDNLGVLKVTRDDAGRLPALSSPYVADLSPANLTGLARVDQDNAFTAGRSAFSGSARVVLPVGANKYQDLGGGLRLGVWIEGTALHHIAQDQTTEYAYVGTFVAHQAGAKAGSVWVEGTAQLHYIDANLDERFCLSTQSGHSDSAARAGSAWVETFVHWIRETGTLERVGHGDTAHSDGTVHSDAAHSDSHGDAHSDTAHSDTAHSDVAHVDQTHVDMSHGDHSDGPGHHGDTPHSDTSHIDTPHLDHAHGDTSHADTHNDVAHSDVAHDDHGDHGDAAHADGPGVV